MYTFADAVRCAVESMEDLWVSFRFQDRTGEEISAERWGELTRDPEYTRVAFTKVMGPDGQPYVVSTVWEGIYTPMRGPRPVFYETLAGTDGEDPSRVVMYPRHTANEEAALAAHETLVHELEAGRLELENE